VILEKTLTMLFSKYCNCDDSGWFACGS